MEEQIDKDITVDTPAKDDNKPSKDEELTRDDVIKEFEEGTGIEFEN